jgi:hypothetical protein
MNSHTIELLISLVFIGVGITSILRKEFSIGLGGRTGSSQNKEFSITLTGSRAIFFGWISFISSLIFIVVWIYTNNNSSSNNALVSQVFGFSLITGIFGGAISTFWESLNIKNNS